MHSLSMTTQGAREGNARREQEMEWAQTELITYLRAGLVYPEGLED